MVLSVLPPQPSFGGFSGPIPAGLEDDYSSVVPLIVIFFGLELLCRVVVGFFWFLYFLLSPPRDIVWLGAT